MKPIMSAVVQSILQVSKRFKMSSSLTLENINKNVRIMEYAVRGPLSIRADQIDSEIKSGLRTDIKEVIKANIGDAQAMGQEPITFIRQCMALTALPQLMELPNFPEDVKQKAKEVLGSMNGKTIGSYPNPGGYQHIKTKVAQFIEKRDGHSCDGQNIVMCSGAKDGIGAALKLLNQGKDGKKAGVMVPIPLYPLYSAAAAEMDIVQIKYYLNEEDNWSLDVEQLIEAVTEAREVCTPRAIVIINPGNPTGQVLLRTNIEEIIKFAYEQNLVILADEVYQENIYQGEFHSFRKVAVEMAAPYNKVQIMSFMSTSKGYTGECGIRGGYMELYNIPSDVRDMLLKEITAMSIPSIMGQVVMFCVVCPPVAGDDSYELYTQERHKLASNLKERATLLAEAFDKMEGITCNAIQGAMYAFPRIHLPPKAIQAAQADGKAPDVYYCFKLLEETGISVVPGSGFGQKVGTYHFRITNLLPTNKMKDLLQRFETFHNKFLRDYL